MPPCPRRAAAGKRSEEVARGRQPVRPPALERVRGAAGAARGAAGRGTASRSRALRTSARLLALPRVPRQREHAGPPPPSPLPQRCAQRRANLSALAHPSRLAGCHTASGRPRASAPSSRGGSLVSSFRDSLFNHPSDTTRYLSRFRFPSSSASARWRGAGGGVASSIGCWDRLRRGAPDLLTPWATRGRILLSIPRCPPFPPVGVFARPRACMVHKQRQKR